MSEAERPLWEVRFPVTGSVIRGGGATDEDAPARGQTTDYLVMERPLWEQRQFDLEPEPEPIRPKRRDRRLRRGEVVRLEPGGPQYRVVRVNECAAYLRRQCAEPKVVELPNGRTFEAHEDGGLLPVSPTAFVIREV